MDLLNRYKLKLRRTLGINVQLKHLAVGAVCVVLVLVWWNPFIGSSVQATPAAPPHAKHFSPIKVENGEFKKNGETFRILSGSIHYFRVPPKYWRDRLTKLKAAGLNTVDTYVPWNLHEPTPGSFDFTGILDLREFLTVAKSLGLYAIVRPGPYICAEWDLGGLPAWLLHDPNMKLRSTYPPFLVAVARYFDRLFAVLNPLQASRGGPVIAFQVENEYLYYGKDQDYMLELYNMMTHKGVTELLFTSDGVHHLEQAIGMLPDDVLVTVNFQEDPDAALAKLKEVQPNKPLFVAEFWTGWFSHWREKSPARTLTPPKFKDHIARIIQLGASFNLYMFHGGTNFGFMNGANIGEGKQYEPDVTSYDYDAPVNEFGQPTMKYMALRELLPALLPNFVQTPLLPIPSTLESVVAYGDIQLTLALPLLDCLPYLPQPEASVKPVSMEMLSGNKGFGQSYGFVMYRTTVSKEAKQIGIRGLKDFGVALIDGFSFKTLSWYDEQTFPISKPTELLQQMTQEIVNDENTVDILVENMGRVNFVTREDKIPFEVLARKGITGTVSIDKHVKNDWKIYSFEFVPEFMKSIESGGRWQRSDRYKWHAPTIYKGSFTLNKMPEDTFADMSNWGKGVLFINNVNIGRYWQVGPQKTLYIPSSVLHRGINKIMVVELIHPSPTTLVPLTDKPMM